jgi:hypothetical protein
MMMKDLFRMTSLVIIQIWINCIVVGAEDEIEAEMSGDNRLSRYYIDDISFAASEII